MEPGIKTAKCGAVKHWGLKQAIGSNNKHDIYKAPFTSWRWTKEKTGKMWGCRQYKHK